MTGHSGRLGRSADRPCRAPDERARRLAPPIRPPPEAVLSFLSHDEISHLISAYGYWVVGGAVALESTGLPVPGEATLIAAAIYAGTAHGLNIWFVIAAAACGAILGDNIGMGIGREVGYRLLVRYGPRIGLSERRIKLGQYLFRRHGGKVVFFGRFVAVLRALAAFLAGANCMAWGRFVAFNAAGGVVWAALYGLSAYYFGAAVQHFARPVGIAAGAAAVIAVIGATIFLRRHERQLEDVAERAMPGPLRPPGRRRKPVPYGSPQPAVSRIERRDLSS